MHTHVKHMIYDFAAEVTKRAKRLDGNKPEETIALNDYLQKEIADIVQQAIDRESDKNAIAIDTALQAAVEYGSECAPHHIRYGTDVMVKALTHHDQTKYELFKKEFKEQWNEEWDEGVAP